MVRDDRCGMRRPQAVDNAMLLEKAAQASSGPVGTITTYIVNNNTVPVCHKATASKAQQSRRTMETSKVMKATNSKLNENDEDEESDLILLGLLGVLPDVLLSPDMVLPVDGEEEDLKQSLSLPPLLLTLPASRTGSPTTVSLETASEGDASFSDTSSSEAVVSLFQSWRDEEEKEAQTHAAAAAAAPRQPQGPLLIPAPPASLLKPRDLSHLYKLSSDELLERLKKRCRPEDLPPVPVLKRRKRPVCHFLNFMGHSNNKASSRRNNNELGKPLSLPQQPSGPLNFLDGIIDSKGTTGSSSSDVQLDDSQQQQQRQQDGSLLLFPKVKYSSSCAAPAITDDPTLAAAAADLEGAAALWDFEPVVVGEQEDPMIL